MLARQRHREILDQLTKTAGVRVNQLARHFGVTEETIRRDLDRLGNDGKLIRTHGGAVPVRDVHHDLPFDVRETTNLPAKRAIAARALRHIDERDVIALDASSTAHELARVLPDVPLTVVTSSVQVVATLMRCAHIQVVSTGGILDRPSRSFTGGLAEQALQRFNINKLFFSSKGVHIQRGLSDSTDEQARVKRTMIDAAETVFLLADHSKFGVRSTVFFARTTDADVLITDGGADAETTDLLTAAGLRVETAPPLPRKG